MDFDVYVNAVEMPNKVDRNGDVKEDKSIKLDLAREIVILRESGLDTKRKAVLTKILGVR